jgi:hypothetical protein
MEHSFIRSPAFDVGAGTFVVAAVWLLFYVIAATGLIDPPVRQDFVIVGSSQNGQNAENFDLKKSYDALLSSNVDERD